MVVGDPNSKDFRARLPEVDNEEDELAEAVDLVDAGSAICFDKEV